jgi:hypothetical protein
MTWRRSNTFVGLAYGQNPLDDPLVAGWDAVVGRDPGAPSDGDSADVDLLRRFHALDTAPLPSPGFFADLERQLAELPPAPLATRKVIGASKAASFRIARPAPGLRSVPQPHRWTSMQRAAAVLSVMLVVSLIVLYQAVPRSSEPPPIPAAVIAKPAIEPIAQFEFAPPMWGMPDATAWTHMEAGLLSIAPATSFTTDSPWYISIDGPLALTVLNGELIVTPAGAAFLYPAHQPGQPPVEVTAGETVSIGPDDTIVYSSTDTATGSNPGSEPALALYGIVGILDSMLPGNSVRPKDVSFITHEYDTDYVPSIPTAGATMTLQRLELAPFDTFVFDPDPDLRYVPLIDPNQTDGLRIEEGALDGLVPNPGAQGIYAGYQLRYLKNRPHTIFNLGDQTADFYFLVVEPFPDAATPTP